MVTISIVLLVDLHGNCMNEWFTQTLCKSLSLALSMECVNCSNRAEVKIYHYQTNSQEYHQINQLPQFATQIWYAPNKIILSTEYTTHTCS